MPVGRPTKHTPELLEKAHWYIENYETVLQEPIPTLSGLAVCCDISKERVSRWQKEDGKDEFRQICARIKAEQELKLIGGGLTRKYDSSLTKLLLIKHGYSDRQEVKHEGEIKGGVMVVPMADNLEQWGSSAAKSQEDLMKDTQED